MIWIFGWLTGLSGRGWYMVFDVPMVGLLYPSRRFMFRDLLYPLFFHFDSATLSSLTSVDFPTYLYVVKSTRFTVVA